MDQIHDLNNELYESLVDDEHDKAENIIDRLIKLYKDLKLSIKR